MMPQWEMERLRNLSIKRPFESGDLEAKSDKKEVDYDAVDVSSN